MLSEMFCVLFGTHGGCGNDPPDVEPPPPVEPTPPPAPPPPPPASPPPPDDPVARPVPNTATTTLLPSLPVTVTCADRTPAATGLNFTAIWQVVPLFRVAPMQLASLTSGNSDGFDEVTLETVSEPVPVADTSRAGLCSVSPTFAFGKL